MIRLNKYITEAGYCSRREADRYIEQGRVTINGIEARLGDMVSATEVVRVDGERVGRRRKSAVYIACHKPVGVTCTTDRSDKTNIIDFLGYKERIFPVGRLDKDSEGLIILTNDGDIVNRILRAGNDNPKEYIVTVDKPVTPAFVKQMSEGVRILGTKTKPCTVRQKNATTLVIHLTQGLNRQIRRMCQALGYKVTRLVRVRVINIVLGDLEPGRWRYFTPEEIRDMNLLLADSSGTEEASNEKKANPRTSHKRPYGDAPGTNSPYKQYRQRGKRPPKSAAAGYPGSALKAEKAPTPTTGHNPEPTTKFSKSPKPTSRAKPKNASSADSKTGPKNGSRSPAGPGPTKGTKSEAGAKTTGNSKTAAGHKAKTSTGASRQTGKFKTTVTTKAARRRK